MVRLGALKGKELATAKTPVDTGDLKKSWKVGRARKVGEAYMADFFTEVEYGPYVEHGTGLYGPEHRKYLILPKKPGGTLHWVDADGVDVFAKGVLHPGSPGAHMVADAVAELEVDMERVVRPALKQWARETERQNPWAK